MRLACRWQVKQHLAQSRCLCWHLLLLLLLLHHCLYKPFLNCPFSKPPILAQAAVTNWGPPPPLSPVRGECPFRYTLCLCFKPYLKRKETTSNQTPTLSQMVDFFFLTISVLGIAPISTLHSHSSATSCRPLEPHSWPCPAKSSVTAQLFLLYGRVLVSILVNLSVRGAWLHPSRVMLDSWHPTCFSTLFHWTLSSPHL